MTTSGSALFAVTVAAGFAATFPAFALTFEEALAHAIETNPTLEVALAGRDAADAQLRQARAGQFPSVDAEGSIATAQTDLGGFFGFGQQTVSPRNAQISLQQPLFAPGVFANVARAKAGQSAANAGAAAARLTLEAMVAEVYSGALAAQKRHEAFRIAFQQTGEIEREAGMLFDRGGLSRTELAQAKARAAEARANLAQAESDLVRAKGMFTTVVGLPPQALEDLGAPPPLPASLDEALALAQSSSPALKIAVAKAEEADAAVRIAKADMLPKVSAVAGAGMMRDQFFPGYRTNDLRVGVQGRINIFSGGLVSGRIAEAEARRRGAHAELEAAKAELAASVATGWQTVISSAATKEAAIRADEAANMAYSDARAEYKVGSRSTTDLLDAQRESLGASLRRIVAAGNSAVSVYRLRAIVGAE